MIGNVGPTIENPVPVTVAVNTVVVAVPGFESVTTWVSAVPTVALPKKRIAGEIVIIPPPVVVAPVPVTGKVVDGFDAFEVKETVPLTVPRLVGPKDRERGTLLPTPTVRGNCPDGTVNSGLSTMAPATVKVPEPAAPVFDN